MSSQRQFCLRQTSPSVETARQVILVNNKHCITNQRGCIQSSSQQKQCCDTLITYFVSFNFWSESYQNISILLSPFPAALNFQIYQGDHRRKFVSESLFFLGKRGDFAHFWHFIGSEALEHDRIHYDMKKTGLL